MIYLKQLAPFDPAKKKKKKEVVLHDPADESIENVTEKMENLTGTTRNKYLPNIYLLYLKKTIVILLHVSSFIILV